MYLARPTEGQLCLRYVPGYVVHDGEHEDGEDEHPGLDVVPLDEKRVPDGQKALNRDRNCRVARPSQGNL